MFNRFTKLYWICKVYKVIALNTLRCLEFDFITSKITGHYGNAVISMDYLNQNIENFL